MILLGPVLYTVAGTSFIQGHELDYGPYRLNPIGGLDTWGTGLPDPHGPTTQSLG